MRYNVLNTMVLFVLHSSFGCKIDVSMRLEKINTMLLELGIPLSFLVQNLFGKSGKSSKRYRFLFNPTWKDQDMT